MFTTRAPTGRRSRSREPRHRHERLSRRARKPARRNESVPALTEVASEHTGPRTVPAAVPTYASSDELADAVARLEGKPVTQIARELGIAERTVRRIQADLGIESI